MSVPAIAVIMPVHNRAATVGRAVASVLAQDFPNFELIAVDDGSTDGSADVVASFADPRIRLIRLSSNLGSNPARNHGIAGSNAPLLAFLDSDDEYLPAKLRTVTDHFTRQPELDLLVDSFVKRVPGRAGDVPRRNRPIADQQAFRMALFTRTLWKATPAITVRRDAAIRAGLFDESLGRLQDFDFLIRVSRIACCAATDATLWVKHESADAISSPGRTLVPSYIELSRRHPELLATSEYQAGLARDVVRQLGRYLRNGQLGNALGDVGRLGSAFGWRRTATLLAPGTWRSRRS